MPGHRRAAPVLAFVLANAAAACGGIDSSAVADADDLTPLRLEQELRIGSIDDPDVGFSRIGGVAIDRDGLVYVLERQDVHIRVYDAEGRRVRTIGRSGSGPGEFGAMSNFGVVGDTIWVADPGLDRLTLMRRTGEVLRTFSIPAVQLEPVQGIVATVTVDALRPDGTIGGRMTRMMFPPSGPPADSFSIPYVRFDTTGALIDTLRSERFAFPGQNTVNVGGHEISVPSPPPSSPLELYAADDRFVIDRPVATAADDARFTVTHITATGDTTFRRTFRYRPREFNAAIIDTLIERRTAFQRERRSSIDVDAMRSALRQAIELPAYQSPVASGHVGEDGVLWLRREDDGGPLRRWLLVGPDGAPRGSLELPRAATIHWSHGGILWAAVRDEFDVPWLVRYGIVAGESP